MKFRKLDRRRRITGAELGKVLVANTCREYAEGKLNYTAKQINELSAALPTAADQAAFNSYVDLNRALIDGLNMSLATMREAKNALAAITADASQMLRDDILITSIHTGPLIMTAEAYKRYEKTATEEQRARDKKRTGIAVLVEGTYSDESIKENGVLRNISMESWERMIELAQKETPSALSVAGYYDSLTKSLEALYIYNGTLEAIAAGHEIEEVNVLAAPVADIEKMIEQLNSFVRSTYELYALNMDGEPFLAPGRRKKFKENYPIIDYAGLTMSDELKQELAEKLKNMSYFVSGFTSLLLRITEGETL